MHPTLSLKPPQPLPPSHPHPPPPQGYLLAKAGETDTVLEHLQPFFYDSMETRGAARVPTEALVEGFDHHAAPPTKPSRTGLSLGPPSLTSPLPIAPALVEALSSWLLSDAIDLGGKLEAVNLMLVLFSSQLYQGLGSALSGEAATNLFLDALMREAVEQNEKATLEHKGDTSGALGFR